MQSLILFFNDDATPQQIADAIRPIAHTDPVRVTNGAMDPDDFVDLDGAIGEHETLQFQGEPAGTPG